MTVKSILETKGSDIVSVKADAKLADAVNLLSTRRIGAVLVLNGTAIDGILSERDVVRVLGERGPSALDEPVQAVMTRKVVACAPADTVAAIMEKMTNGKFRHLPVVENGRLLGLISIGDVVKRRVSEFEKEQAAMRDYIATA